MASVFTYDPDPPKISSPWSNTPVSTPILKPINDGDRYTIGGLVAATPFLLEGSGLTKLDPEPQDGPVEYKLHLLLRPRIHHFGMSLPVTSTALQQLRLGSPSIHVGTADRPGLLKPSSTTPPIQVRQSRLEHLTTQLLWRLQQSSPYHSQSTLRLVPPLLPESGPVLSLPTNTEKLVPGLEESRGALYEIGVADDGTFIGLTKEEIDESLVNLRSMAASLGCKVEILKTVIVGEYEEDQTAGLGVISPRKIQKLWVVEALVLPNTHQHTSDNAPASPLEVKKLNVSEIAETTIPLHLADFHTEQLRVSLTGSTTSGKSSLVGTLSTSALDSGRGKTRLSLLKHRHEIESGVTSSVAPELIGYHTNATGEVQVVNYGFGNTSSWNDIHNAAEGERLVFLLDSAGHPRYRRTALRGLVSWAPHWTICCVAADETEDFASQPTTTIFSTEGGNNGSESLADSSNTHLDLCLKLGLRLIVVVTKLDLATNFGLRNTLSKILSVVKAAGRNPVLLKPDQNPRTSDELQTLSTADIVETKSIFKDNDSSTTVPIVLTSAVRGSGIRKLHALLRYIPVLPDNSDTLFTTDQDTIFHIDEVFAKQSTAFESDIASTVNILSGHLCYGDLEIGDQVFVGPCAIDAPEVRLVELSRARSYPSRMSINTPPPDLSRSAPKTGPLLPLDTGLSTKRSVSEAPSRPSQLTFDTSPIQDEWLAARITSIRNLRLPLRKLLAGQVGTIGIEFVPLHTSTHKLRKGMVIVKQNPQSQPPRACSGVKVILASSCYDLMEPGALFTIYVASIRASAKIISVEIPTTMSPAASTEENEHISPSTASKDMEQNGDDSVFLFDDPDSVQPSVTYSKSGRREVRDQPPLDPEIEVSFLFVSGREWVEVGSKVLAMSTAVLEGSSGLDGVVGVVSNLF